MQTTDLRSHLIRLSTIPLMAAGLIALVLPLKPAAANPFEDCTTSLTRAGIVDAEAADACGAALYPRDLSKCVSNISGDTEITANVALASCRQVRRPEELGECVTDINSDTDGAVLRDVLNYCRRSLLPTRFSECVVGVSRDTDLSVAQALDSCISASNLPRNLRPDFVPRPEDEVELNPSVPPSQLPPTLPFESIPLPETTPSPVSPVIQPAPATPAPQQ